MLVTTFDFSFIVIYDIFKHLYKYIIEIIVKRYNLFIKLFRCNINFIGAMYLFDDLTKKIKCKY